MIDEQVVARTEIERRFAYLERIKQEHAELVEALGGMMELVKKQRYGPLNAEWKAAIIAKSEAILENVK